MPSVRYTFDLKEPLRTYALEVLEELGKDKPKDLGIWVQGQIAEWRKGFLQGWYVMQAEGYGTFPSNRESGKEVRVEPSDCHPEDFVITDRDGGEFFFTMSERFQERLKLALSVHIARLTASKVEDLSDYNTFDKWLERFISIQVATAKAKLEQDEDDEELKVATEQRKKEEDKVTEDLEKAKKAAEAEKAKKEKEEAAKLGEKEVAK